MTDKILTAPDDEDGTLCPYGLGYLFYESMQKYKNNIAQIDVINGYKDTYSQLLQRSIHAAIELKARGITREDIITLNTNNHLESSVPFIAAQFLGCRVASLDPSIPLEDARYLLEQVNPRIIFTTFSARQVIAEAISNLPKKPEVVVFGTVSFEAFIQSNNDDDFQPVKVNPNDIAVILFSSGTTGLPKGICCSHLMQAKSGKSAMATINGEVMLCYSSLYWISAVNLLIESCRLGGARLLASKFDPVEFWNIAETYKPTMSFCAPSQIIQIMKNKPKIPLQLNSLSTISVGGGPVPIEYLSELGTIFPNLTVIQGWGQTELGIVTKFLCTKAHMELLRKYPLSCGVLMPGNSAKVVDPETNVVLGANQIGEIRVKSNFQMTGYHNKDSKEVFDTEGFICTGDIGYYNEDKCFFIVDRLKEMLKYQSWHVTPAKIESILLKHPSVAEAVVIGKPHNEDGDHPLALVVLNKNNTISPDELRKYVDEQLDDRHKLRGGVIFVNNLLYTSTGKFKRSEMRQRILKGITKF